MSAAEKPRVDDAVIVPAKPAATVTLLRERDDDFEVLLVRRNRKLAFHGGAWVFPGGRVDDGDHVPAAVQADEIEAARRAAAREVREEAGVQIEPRELVVFARWITPEGLPKRFDTLFFAVRVDGEGVRVDGNEIHAHCWLRARQALDAHARGELELPPPTFVTLSQFAPYRVCESLLRDLTERPVETFAPRLHVVPGGACCVYEGDAAYDAEDLEAPGPQHRLWMLDSGWRYERRDDAGRA